MYIHLYTYIYELFSEPPTLNINCFLNPQLFNPQVPDSHADHEHYRRPPAPPLLHRFLETPLPHPRGNPGANLKSKSYRCYLREVAFEWELT